LDLIDTRNWRQTRLSKGLFFNLAFTPDSRWLLATESLGGGPKSQRIRAWNLASGETVDMPGIPLADFLSPLAVGKSGKVAIVSNGQISIWNFPSGTLLRSLNRGASSTGAQAISGDGSVFASGQTNDAIVVWSASLGHPIATYSGRADSPKFEPSGLGIQSLVFSPDGKYLISSSLGLWNYFSTLPVVILDEHTGRQAAVIDTHGDRVATGGKKALLAVASSKGIELRTTPEGQLVDTLPWDHQWMEPIAFSADGRWLAGVSGGGHAGITLWDLDADAQSHNFPFPSSDLIQAATFSPDSRLLAFGATNHIRVWDVNSRSMRFEIPAHSGWVSALAFSPDGRFLVSGSWDQTVKIWDAQTGAFLRTLNGHTNTVRGLSFLSGHLLSSSEDGTFKLWDPETGDLLATTFNFESASQWLVVTPTGLFDGTADAMSLVGWRQQDFGVVPIESFYNDFFHPDLLPEILDGERPQAQIDIATMIQIPGLRMMLVQNQAHLDVRDGRVVVCFANRPDVASRTAAGDPDLPAEVDGYRVVPGESTCKYQKDLNLPSVGTKQSELIQKLENSKPVVFNTPWDGRLSSTATSTLHVLSVGVQRYPNDSGFDELPYAVSSAKAVQDFFQGQGSSEAKPYAQVHVWPGLYDAAATRDAIRQRLTEMGKAMSGDDVALIYLAGHGVVATGQEMFYFASFDGRERDIRDSGLNTAMLADALRDMPARRIVLVIDSCQSGGAVEALSKIGEVKARVEQRRAKLALEHASNSEYQVGVHIIAAAMPQQYAVQLRESESALAATILESLQRSPGTVTVDQMINYLKTRLPEASLKATGYSQVPLTNSVGSDFPLAGR
jgi:WD40 repeat protein